MPFSEILSIRVSSSTEGEYLFYHKLTDVVYYYTISVFTVPMGKKRYDISTCISMFISEAKDIFKHL